MSFLIIHKFFKVQCPFGATELFEFPERAGALKRGRRDLHTNDCSGEVKSIAWRVSLVLGGLVARAHRTHIAFPEGPPRWRSSNMAGTGTIPIHSDYHPRETSPAPQLDAESIAPFERTPHTLGQSHLDGLVTQAQSATMSGTPNQGPGLRYPSNKKSIYDRNLNRSKNAELSRAAFAYLFIEMIAYAQRGVTNVGDLEQKYV